MADNDLQQQSQPDDKDTAPFPPPEVPFRPARFDLASFVMRNPGQRPFPVRDREVINAAEYSVCVIDTRFYQGSAKGGSFMLSRLQADPDSHPPILALMGDMVIARDKQNNVILLNLNDAKYADLEIHVVDEELGKNERLQVSLVRNGQIDQQVTKALGEMASAKYAYRLHLDDLEKTPAMRNDPEDQKILAEQRKILEGTYESLKGLPKGRSHDFRYSQDTGFLREKGEIIALMEQGLNMAPGEIQEQWNRAENWTTAVKLLDGYVKRYKETYGVGDPRAPHILEPEVLDHLTSEPEKFRIPGKAASRPRFINVDENHRNLTYVAQTPKLVPRALRPPEPTIIDLIRFATRTEKDAQEQPHEPKEAIADSAAQDAVYVIDTRMFRGIGRGQGGEFPIPDTIPSIYLFGNTLLATSKDGGLRAVSLLDARHLDLRIHMVDERFGINEQLQVNLVQDGQVNQQVLRALESMATAKWRYETPPQREEDRPTLLAAYTALRSLPQGIVHDARYNLYNPKEQAEMARTIERALGWEEGRLSSENARERRDKLEEAIKFFKKVQADKLPGIDAESANVEPKTLELILKLETQARPRIPGKTEPAPSLINVYEQDYLTPANTPTVPVIKQQGVQKE